MDWRARETIYTDATQTRVVPAGPEAAFVLAGANAPVDAATVRRYGLEPYCFSPAAVEEIVVEAMSQPNPDGRIRLSDPVADAARRYQEQQSVQQAVPPAKARKTAEATG